MPNPLERLKHHVSGAIARGEAEPITEQRAYAVILNAGADSQEVHSDHASWIDALREQTRLAQQGTDADVMKRLPDGTLTTEF